MELSLFRKRQCSEGINSGEPRFHGSRFRSAGFPRGVRAILPTNGIPETARRICINASTVSKSADDEDDNDDSGCICESVYERRASAVAKRFLARRPIYKGGCLVHISCIISPPPLPLSLSADLSQASECNSVCEARGNPRDSNPRNLIRRHELNSSSPFSFSRSSDVNLRPC